MANGLLDPVTPAEIAAFRARQQTQPIRSLLAPEEGYEYGDLVPLRTSGRRVLGRTRAGQPIYGESIEPTVPLAAREGIKSVLNLAEGTQTGMVNPMDVMNVMPMGAAASLLDEGIEGGMTAGMFIGRGNRRANPEAFARAEELRAAGKTPEDIWRQTYQETGAPILVGRDSQLRQEIPDVGEINASELADVAQNIVATQDNSAREFYLESFVSPEYARAFMGRDAQSKISGTPLVRVMGFKEGAAVDASSASYSPAANTIALNPVYRDPITLEIRPKTEEELRSSLLHELQHKAQGADGLSTGSNEQIARQQFDDMFGMIETSQAMRQISERAREIERYRPRFSDVNRAETAKYYEELSQRDNVGNVARKIFNNAEWYRVGDDIVNELGPVPKRSGEARNEWLRQAASRLSNVFAQQVQDKSLLDMDRKKLQSEYRKIQRKAFPSDSYETMNANRFVRGYIDELRTDPRAAPDEAISPYTAYRRKLGETEARATQAREQMTMEQRAAVFPERSYDEPPNAMIIDRELFQDTPQGLLTLTRPRR